MIKVVGLILQIVLVWITHRFDRDKQIKAEKERILKNAKEAFRIKDKSLRASALNSCVNDARELRRKKS